jgi:hypothetical protein
MCRCGMTECVPPRTSGFASFARRLRRGYCGPGLTGFFSIIYVPSRLIVSDNVAQPRTTSSLPRGFSASAVGLEGKHNVLREAIFGKSRLILSMCGILVGVESIQRLAPCLLAISFITVRMKSLPLRHSAITLASISFALSLEISKPLRSQPLP